MTWPCGWAAIANGEQVILERPASPLGEALAAEVWFLSRRIPMPADIKVGDRYLIVSGRPVQVAAVAAETMLLQSLVSDNLISVPVEYPLYRMGRREAAFEARANPYNRCPKGAETTGGKPSQKALALLNCQRTRQNLLVQEEGALVGKRRFWADENFLLTGLSAQVFKGELEFEAQVGAKMRPA